MKALKQAIVLSLPALLAGGFASNAWAAPDLSSYGMVFNDEFTGSSLDTSKWATAPIWGPFVRINNEDQYYLDKAGLDAAHPVDPFLFDGDILTIRATPLGTDSLPPQPAVGDPIWAQYPEYTYNADYLTQNTDYYSGLISSVNSFTFTHGYAEARVKVPAGQGLWPAFWQLTNKYVEDAPEIDIVETLGQFPNEANHTMHYFDTSNNWALISTPTYKSTGIDYTADFHTYGMMWSPKAVTWFVDGVEVQRTENTEFKTPKQAMYVIANLAVGGSWPGPADATTPFPADFHIDYIRVYQRTPPAEITPATLATDYQLMFADEFTGTSLDETLWNTSFLWGPHLQINNEEQVYIDVQDTHSNYSNNPFEVSGGTLKITAEEVAQTDLPVQPPEGDPYWTAHPERQHNGDYNNTWIPGYTSGIITSYDSFKFVHGYVEYRAKLPAGDGLWPAFWLLNGYYVGQIPEIDILETQGELPNVSHHSYHYFDTNGNAISSPGTYELPTGDFSDGFHRFGVKWHPGEIVWYVDGVAVRTLTGPEVSLQLMYLLANLAVGGNFVGVVGDAFPATLEVDYIRAYQLREYPVAAPPPPPPSPGAVTPLSPLSSVDTATPTFEWDETTDVEEYRLVVYDRTLLANVHNVKYDSGDICSEGTCTITPAAVSLEFSVNHFWVVRGENSTGAGEWSPTAYFDYLDSSGALPGVIAPLSPLSNVDTATPIFEWDETTDAEEYRLVVYDRTLLAYVHNVKYDSGDICSEGTCIITPAAVSLEFSVNHFWVVRGENSTGAGEWSPTAYFDYLDSSGALPGVIAPLSPLLNVDTATPIFEWDETSDAEEYRLVVYDRTLLANVHNVKYDSGDICSEGTCTITPAAVSLEFSVNHFWVVRGENSTGAGEWSPTAYFDYLDSSGALPGVIAPLSPLSNVDTATPIFEWDETTDAEEYRLVVYDRTLLAYVHNVKYDSGDICSEGTCIITPAAVSLEFSVNHFWVVRGENSSGAGEWSPTAYFDYLEQ